MLKDIAAFCNTTSTFELVLKMKKKTKTPKIKHNGSKQVL